MTTTATRIRITVDGVTMRLSGRTVLSVPRLVVEGPGLVALVGPNGAGKSTLLRLVAGLAKPTSGQVLIGEASAVGTPAHGAQAQEHCGYVPDHPVLFEDMTVADNMWYVAWTAGRREIPPEALAMINRLGFLDLLDRFPSQLSRGQRQMACLLVAASRPIDCLLLDEPSLALDEANRGVLAETLAERGRSGLVVVVSHEDAIIEAADRIIHLENGAIVDDD